MSRLARSWVLFSLIALTACGPSAPVRPEKAGKKVIVEPPVERPVVLADKGGEALITAIGLLKAKNYRQAEANLEEIIKVRPDLAEAFFNLGLAKQKLGKHNEAIVQLQAGLKLKPADIEAINLVAISQRSLGRFADAEITYRHGLTLAPTNDALHLNIGILYELYLFKPELALEHYRQYLTLAKTPDGKVAGWIAQLERKAGK